MRKSPLKRSRAKTRELQLPHVCIGKAGWLRARVDLRNSKVEADEMRTMVMVVVSRSQRRDSSEYVKCDCRVNSGIINFRVGAKSYYIASSSLLHSALPQAASNAVLACLPDYDGASDAD
jgi:hypothetical protein